MKIYNSVAELIGRTPLIRLKKIEEHFNLDAKIIAKVEGFNPAGSVKDRVAKAMFEDASKSIEFFSMSNSEEFKKYVDNGYENVDEIVKHIIEIVKNK